MLSSTCQEKLLLLHPSLLHFGPGSHSFLAGHVGHVAAALHSKAAAGHPTHGHPINSTGTWRSAGILRLSDCWRSKFKRCHIWGRCRLRWEPRMWWNWRTWWNCGIKKNTMIRLTNENNINSRKTINESMTFIAFLMDFRCGLTGQIGAFANSPVVVESRFGPARSRWWLRYQFDLATFQEMDLVFDPFSSVDPHVKQNELCVVYFHHVLPSQPFWWSRDAPCCRYFFIRSPLPCFTRRLGRARANPAKEAQKTPEHISQLDIKWSNLADYIEV